MEGRIEVINSKPRKVTTRYGKDYIRVGIEIEVNHFSRAEQKAQFFGKNFTDLVRELVAAFNNNFGIEDQRVKDPGDLFDPRMSRHTQTAARRTIEEISQCPFHTN